MGWGIGGHRFFEKWVKAELRGIHEQITLRAEADKEAVRLAAEGVAEKFRNDMQALYVRQAVYREDKQKFEDRLNKIEVCDSGVGERKTQVAVNTKKIGEIEGTLGGINKYILLLGTILGAILMALFQHFNK